MIPVNEWDISVLRLLLSHDDLAENHREAFTSILAKLPQYGEMTGKQRDYARDIAIKLDLALPPENLVSRRKIPDPGSRFEPLDSMPKGPLKPPKRRTP